MPTLIGIDKQVFSPPEPGCSLYLSGLPGASSKIYDRSPYGNIGTITGATWKRLPSGLWYLDFDGTDDFVDCGAGASLNITAYPFTVEMWVNPSRIPPLTEQGLISKYGDSSATRSWKLFFKRNGAVQNLALYLYRADGVVGIDDLDIAGGTAITINIWRHLVVVFGTSAIVTYLNGALAESTAHTETSIFGVNYPLELGRHNLGAQDELGGSMTLVRIYTRALSALEIQNHFSQEKHLFGVW